MNSYSSIVTMGVGIDDAVSRNHQQAVVHLKHIDGRTVETG